MRLSNWLTQLIGRMDQMGAGCCSVVPGLNGKRRSSSRRSSLHAEAFEARLLLSSAPTGVDDSYSVEQDLTLNIPVDGVLTNDTDPDFDVLSAVLENDVLNGTLGLNAEGSFSYTPFVSFVGSDSFTYHPSDGLLDGNTTTVSIDVTASGGGGGGGGGGNNAPVADDDLWTVQWDSLSIGAPGVLEDDSDPDSDPLTAILDSDVQHGTLTLNANGSFDYTPDAGYLGTDSFTYTAGDGTDTSDPATVTLTVIDPFGARVNQDDLPLRQLSPGGGVGIDRQTGEAGVGHAIGGSQSLSYRSLSSGQVVIAVDTHLDALAAVPDQIETRLTVGGQAGPTIFYDGSLLSGGVSLRLATQFDGGTQATGYYDWQLDVISRTGSNEKTQSYSGDVAIVNRDGGVFGANWNVAGVSQLFIQNDGALLVAGSGAASWFADSNGTYISPVGPFRTSTLVKNVDNSFTLTSKYGSRYEYDADGLLTDRIDNNGNTVSFTYIDADLDGASDDLSVMTGVYGRTLSFSYDAGGYLESVTDHAGRVTSVSIDGTGKVSSITSPDPDGTGPLAAAVTGYTYDSDGLLTTISTTLGRTTQLQYNFAGQLTQVTNPLGNLVESLRDVDGRVTQVTQPDPDQAGPQTAPVTTYMYDADGNLTTVTLPDGSTQTSTYDATLHLPLTMTDPLGRTTTFTYDANGNRLTQTDALGNTTTYVYDSFGKATSVTLPDPDGAGPAGAPVMTTTYDSLGRPTQVTNPDGTTRQIAYDSADNVISRTDELGRVTTFVFGELGRQTTVTLPDPDGAGPQTAPVSTFVYDAGGRIESQTDPAGNQAIYAYDAMDQVLSVTLPDPDGAGPLSSPIFSTTYDAAGRQTSQTDAMGNTTSVTYNAASQLTDSVTMPDPDGTIGPQAAPVIHFEYDDIGRRTKVTDPHGNDTDYAYDSRGRVTSVTDATGNVTASAYDSVGNVVSVTDALGGVTSSTYDALNRLLTMTQPDPDGVGPLSAPVTSFAYDNLDRRTSVTDPVGSVTTTAFDVMGRVTSLTDALGNVTSFAYDAVGNRTSVTDPLGNVSSTAYDDLNLVVSVTDAESGVTTFTRDILGNMNMLSLTDPVGNTTTWAYDNLSRLTQETNALNDSRTFDYNANGNLITRTDRLGRSIDYDYDNLQRLYQEHWIAADGVTVENTVDLEYDGNNRVLTIADDVSAYAFVYDAVGNVTLVDNVGTTDSPNLVLTNAYDALGRRTSVSATVDGTADFSNTYAYDALGRMTQIEQTSQMGGNSVSDKRVDLTYNDRGQFASITRYEDLFAMQEVATSTYGYDADGRPTSLDHDQSGSSLADYTWTWDAAGRITSATNIDGSSTYSYDDTSQLTGATHSFQSDETYSYDANGNRTLTGYSSGTNNQLLSDGTHDYEYDAEGNRTKKTTIATGDYVEYSWDHRNRLTAVTFRDSSDTVTKSVAYTYDALNRRISKSADADGTIDRSESFLYDSTTKLDPGVGVPLDDIVLIHEDSDGSGPGPSALSPQPSALSSRLLHGPAVDQVFAEEQAAGDLFWLLADHQGTIRDVADYDDMLMMTTVTNHRTYDSFGALTNETDASVDTHHGYTGREFDTDTDLTYYRARWYDATTGQLITEDPIGFAGGDTNLNRYVGNTVLRFTDPSGHTSFDPVGGTDATVGMVDVPLSPPSRLTLILRQIEEEAEAALAKAKTPIPKVDGTGKIHTDELLPTEVPPDWVWDDVLEAWDNITESIPQRELVVCQ